MKIFFGRNFDIIVYISPSLIEGKDIHGRCLGDSIFIGFDKLEGIDKILVHEIIHVLQGKPDVDRISRELVASWFEREYLKKEFNLNEFLGELGIDKKNIELIQSLLKKLNLENVKQITYEISKILGKKDVFNFSSYKK